MATEIEALSAAVAALQDEQTKLGTAINAVVAAIDADVLQITTLQGQLATAIASPANGDTAAITAASDVLVSVTSNLAGYAAALTAAIPHAA